MLHHVGIEVAPADIEATVGFFELLGFERVEPPEALREYTWLEQDGTQIHLMPRDDPLVPQAGHLAVVVPDFEEALRRLQAAGFAAERRREHWGSPRAWATAPGRHRVELMAAPPAPRA
ncbi:MAG TPA: VOC family protein [Solirubrobacterales bacterium]|nr:VOC family protein [Solirubrobacterales bacterium]